MCDFSIDDIDYIINHPKLSDEYKFKYVEDIANQELFLDWFDNEVGLGVTLEELGLKLEDLTDFYDLDETDYIHTEEMFVESYNDYPNKVSENAKIALRWVEENGWGSCGTSVGKARANQLAKREPISRETIARMSSFERHRQSSQKELGDGCGRLMWLAWGGDEGIEWAKSKLEQIDNVKMDVIDTKISFDYDDTLSTKRGFELAKSKIDEGYIVYIISARQNKDGMFKRADELGIPHSRVYATGSNKSKVEKIKSLGITKHYDNNSDVVKELGSLGYQFASSKLIPLYQYRSDFYGASNVGDKTRRWCKTMVTRTNLSLMRKQDIESMNSSNPGFGKGGSDSYSVFNWRGGSNCLHKWVKYYYNPDTQNMVKAPDQPIQDTVNGKVPYANGTNSPKQK